MMQGYVLYLCDNLIWLLAQQKGVISHHTYQHHHHNPAFMSPSIMFCLSQQIDTQVLACPKLAYNHDEKSEFCHVWQSHSLMLLLCTRTFSIITIVMQAITKTVKSLCTFKTHQLVQRLCSVDRIHKQLSVHFTSQNIRNTTWAIFVGLSICEQMTLAW